MLAAPFLTGKEVLTVGDFVVKIIVQRAGINHRLVTGFAFDVDAFMGNAVIDPAAG